ncbi:hypothetical protein KI387_022288, partial [Taxus chinensis]
DRFLGVVELFQVERVSSKFGMAQDVPPEPYIWLRAIKSPKRAGAREGPIAKQLAPLSPNEVDTVIEVIDADNTGSTSM